MSCGLAQHALLCPTEMIIAVHFVRKQSVFEMQTFKSRWNNAVEEDKCWVDPYPKPANQTIH
ncbi:hypothetical protein CsSME_00024980 [Camellia sinensis var. sinensis]